MAKTVSKPAGGQLVKGGSTKMHPFTPVGTQKAGSTSVAGSGGNKNPGGSIPRGPTGKIGGKQVGVQAQKPGRTGQR